MVNKIVNTVTIQPMGGNDFCVALFNSDEACGAPKPEIGQ